MKKIIFVLFVAAALAIRLILVFKPEPFSDEIWGFFFSRYNPVDTWIANFADLTGPLYYLFLHPLYLLLKLGFNIYTLRLFSLFFGLLTSLCVSYLGYYVFGKRVGLIALLISLFLPSYIWISVFGRFYSLLSFTAALVVIFYIRFLKTSQVKNLLVCFLGIIIGSYIHYYFLLLFLCLFVHMFMIKPYRKLRKTWVKFTLLISFFLLPGLYYFFTLPKPIVTTYSNNLLKIPLSFITNITSFQTFMFLNQVQQLILYLPLLAALFISTGYLFLLGFQGRKNDIKILFLLVLVLPLILIILVSYTLKPVFGANSLIIFLPIFTVILAKGIDIDLQKRRIFTAAFIILTLTIWIPFYQSFTLGEMFARPYKYVKSHFETNDLILHNDMYTFINAKYYLGNAKNFGGVPTLYTPQIEKAHGYKILKSEQINTYTGRLWYFEPFFYNRDEARVVKNRLDNNFNLLTVRRFPDSNINVYLYQSK